MKRASKIRRGDSRLRPLTRHPADQLRRAVRGSLVVRTGSIRTELPVTSPAPKPVFLRGTRYACQGDAVEPRRNRATHRSNWVCRRIPGPSIMHRHSRPQHRNWWRPLPSRSPSIWFRCRPVPAGCSSLHGRLGPASHVHHRHRAEPIPIRGLAGAELGCISDCNDVTRRPDVSTPRVLEPSRQGPSGR